MTARDTNRNRNLRARAKRLDLVMVKQGPVVTLTDRENRPVFTGDVPAVEEWVAARYSPRRPGPPLQEVPELWRPWIDLLVSELRAARRAHSTISLRVQRLVSFARSRPGCDPLTVTRADLIEYLAGAEHWTPEYAHSVRTSFRVFFALLDDIEARPNNPAQRLPRVQIARGLPRPCPDTAIRAALNDVTDERIVVAIRLGAEAGLRRMEIAGLRRDAVEGCAGNYRLRIRGKGGHERIVPISDDLAAPLLDIETVHIFPGMDGPISARHLGKLIAAALPNNWTAHTLRHRYATAAYAASRGDLRVVQELLGHQSPATTARYTQISDESIRNAAIGAAL